MNWPRSSAGAMQPQRRPLLCPTLIGRDGPLAILLEWVGPATGDTAHVVVVSGDAGIGKSRLLAEARRSVADRAVFIEGRCFEESQVVSYAPVLDAFRNLERSGRGNVGDLASAVGRLLRATTARPGTSDRHRRPDLESRERERYTLFDRLARLYLETVAEVVDGGRMAVLTFEDIHWCDESTFDWLLHLLRHAPTPLLLTHRPADGSDALLSFLAELDRMRVVTEVRLQGLGGDEVAAMIQEVFGLTQPPRRPFVNTLVEMTDGNPFFVEEVLNSLVASGHIYRTGLHWQRLSIDSLEIPRSVQVAVQQRLAGLDPQARQLLDLAAVAGQRFDFDLLKSVTGDDEAHLLERIKSLMHMQLVVEEVGDRFAFRHALTRQAIYAAMLARERRRLHKQIGAAFERAAGEERAAELSYHYYTGGQWDKAVYWAERAGARDQAVHAPESAVEHYTRAIDATRQLSQAPPTWLLLQRAQAYQWLGAFKQARGDCSAALDRARADRDRVAEWQCLIDLAAVSREDDFVGVGDLLELALTLARELGDSAKVAETLSLKGFWHMMSDQPSVARSFQNEALATFVALGDRRGQAATLDHLGWSNYVCADLIAAQQSYAAASNIFRDLHDVQGLASSRAGVATAGVDYFQRSAVWPWIDPEQCVRDVEEVIDLSLSAGWRSGECRALIWGGLSVGMFGNYNRALDWAQRGLVIACEDHQVRYESTAEILLGALLLDLLAPEDAIPHLERSVELARSIGSATVTATATSFLALALSETGASARAESILGEPAAKSRMADSMTDRLTWSARAKVALDQNRAADALAVIDALLESAPNAGTQPIPYLVSLSGEALARLGRWSEAGERLAVAAEAADRFGARPLAWRSHLAAARVERHRNRARAAAAHEVAARQHVEVIVASIADATLRARFLDRAEARFPDRPKTTSLAARLGLTPREVEIAVLIGQGRSNRAIARSLRISERTVEKHVENILGKLSLDSRTQVALWVTNMSLGAEQLERSEAKGSPGPSRSTDSKPL